MTAAGKKRDQAPAAVSYRRNDDRAGVLRWFLKRLEDEAVRTTRLGPA
ncbi:MAG: hypothetical protein WCR74_02355 [Betaproteobacteria bacterium]|nr:hypothetical protein [Pseudomonadota bacterium]